MTTLSMPNMLGPRNRQQFNHMISGLRALEHAVTERFLRGRVNRYRLATTVREKLDLIQTELRSEFGEARCNPPYCEVNGICVVCSDE